MRKIGIMGGTFDPIHIGHLLLAQWAKEAAGLDEVWVMPTGCSYMKAEQKVTSPLERYEMVALAVEDNPCLFASDAEINRQGYTYTYETLEQLRTEYPENHFYFIFGADCLFSIENWKYPDRIFNSCTIIASVRGGSSGDTHEEQIQKMQNKIEELEAKYQAEIILLPFMQLDISSTEIRKRVREGSSIRYLVSDKVIHYIKEKGLYQDETY